MGHALSRLAAATRRHVLWLLVGVYALAAIAPAPGLALRDLRLTGLSLGGEPVRFSLVMVAVMLFCGAATLDFRRLGELARRPRALAVGLVGVWLPGVALVAAAGAVSAWWPSEGPPVGVLVGLALAASMPVANSAVGWTQQSEGNLVWALGLVVLTITLCPWVAPKLLWLMGMTLSPLDEARVDTIVSRFSGWVFVVWVVGPTALGLALRRWAGKRRIGAAKPALLLATAAALLLLNYANGALALPRALADPDWPLLVATVAAAIALPLVGLAAAWALAPVARLSRRSRAAWAYALSMKNTGLALSLADTALGDEPAAVLVILVATLAQHVVAGCAHAARRG